MPLQRLLGWGIGESVRRCALLSATVKVALVMLLGWGIGESVRRGVWWEAEASRLHYQMLLTACALGLQTLLGWGIGESAQRCVV
jgi:hypothetical protein